MKQILLVAFSLFIISCSSSDADNINSGQVESEACKRIKEGVEKAKQEYLNSPQNTTEEKCKLYSDALKDQISVCGDSNGEIQKIIDSLKDCKDNN